MPHYLGIDYGEKRIGLSFADAIGVAVPLQPIRYKESARCWELLEQVITNRKITHLVIGYPFNIDGSMSQKIKEVEHFIAQLKQHVDLPVTRVDERLTTFQAEHDVKILKLKRYRKAQSIRKHRRNRASGDIDSRAAVLILQDYLSTEIVDKSTVLTAML